MIQSTFTIAFDFPIEYSEVIIPLTAEVEEHHSDLYYVIKNVHSGSGQSKPVLPDVEIKKMGTHWVHCDSNEETHLSIRAGNAIDAHFRTSAFPRGTDNTDVTHS